MLTGHETNRDTIRAAIRDFILQQFPVARKTGLTDEESLLQRNLVDSLGILEVVTFLEQRFGVTLSDDELLSDHFDSIESLTSMVHSKLQCGD